MNTRLTKMSEDDHLMNGWIPTEQSKMTSLMSDLKPQFVFLAACNSENVGRIFLKAGVKHVICVDQNQRILDRAAIEFSKIFYDEVFDDGNSICSAF